MSDKDRIKNFYVVINNHEFEGEMNAHDCWDIKGKLSNGVRVNFNTPPRWAYSRVMQFLGNVIEARIL